MDDYFTAIEKAGKEINPVARAALAEVGVMLQADMISRCPSDKLKPYIKVFTPSKEGDFNYLMVGYIRDTPKEIAIAANSVEFGSVHNAPMPHIRPAIRSMRAKVNAHIVAKLKAAGLVDS